MPVLTRPLRPLLWAGSSKRDFVEFPPPVQDSFGFALFLVQTGQYPGSSKFLKGFGSGVMELIEDHDGGSYRAIYVVRFSGAVYVLHAFKKKSKRGIKTPPADIALIRSRLRDAAADHAERFKRKDKP